MKIEDLKNIDYNSKEVQEDLYKHCGWKAPIRDEQRRQWGIKSTRNRCEAASSGGESEIDRN